MTTTKNPKEILRGYWGYADFRGSQEKIIQAILDGKDVLGLMPTGGGKSLCYQVPSMAQEGICIVVSPLVALIQNQVDALKKKGIKAIALTGGIPFDEVDKLLDNCLYGNYKFLYLSPERLQQELVQTRIEQMNVNLIAIDEAHCISHWGHDFRPAYLDCAKLRGLLPETPMIALTATATAQVAADICDNLKFIDPLIVKDSFERTNIAFKVVQKEDKLYQLKQLCSKLEKSAIVYVQTRRMAEELSRFLNKNGLSASYFHGGNTKVEKQERLKLWLENRVQTMVATNAFGMGIDKSDVELVVHYQIPNCIENYFQEAGRAGRDGSPARAILLTNQNDIELAKNQFLKTLPNAEFLKLTYKKLNNYFQIAYNEGVNETFQLNFNEFCMAYGLNPILTYNALKILDQQSVIALSESFSKKTSVRFLADKDQIFRYLESNHQKAMIAQMLLRTYGGVFDHDTKINTALVAKKVGVQEFRVINALEGLHKDEIIDLKAKHSDIELTFLVPREDERTINTFASKVKELHQIKIDNLESMTTYVGNDKICRSLQILRYFGENHKKECGVCDVCLAQKTTPESSFDSIQKKVLSLLYENAMSSRELSALISDDEKVVLAILRGLLEDEKININTKNQYYIDRE
ncbi:ATP-dependent DNA helicase RecQ [Maribacter algicola]|uniref:ATP-dependent DNA helicase RecQ n=1 Tax=Meishania litoralis TaxID=3434685 RepID=A0ACC7LIV3_9FLAO